MTPLQGGHIVILQKSEGTCVNCGRYPRTPDRASLTIFLILNYIKILPSPKVQRQHLCLLVQFLGDPGQ